jgi:hypothetical protein
VVDGLVGLCAKSHYTTINFRTVYGYHPYAKPNSKGLSPITPSTLLYLSLFPCRYSLSLSSLDALLSASSHFDHSGGGPGGVALSLLTLQPDSCGSGMVAVATGRGGQGGVALSLLMLR